MSEMYTCKELCCSSQNLAIVVPAEQRVRVGLGGTVSFGNCALHVLQTISTLVGRG